MEKISVYYGRVSTKKHEQDSSITNQEQYFKEKGIIKGYIDRSGGTTIEKREEFQNMLKECGLNIRKIESGTKHKSVVVDSNRESKVKYIYTKSIQRFARNVSECLEICRMLADKGTYVIFEDLNKSTEDTSFFMTMSIMATMAENESIEKSRSIKMGASMSAKRGVVRSWSAYGYIYNKKENTMTAIPEEAEIVKKIFELKAAGLGCRRISNILNEEGYKTRNNKDWRDNVISRMIKNPIYFGATARNRYNTNKLYGNNKHVLKAEEEWIITENNKVEPIISKELWDKCQEVRKKLTSPNIKAGKYMGTTEFANKILCENCGNYYSRNKDTKVRSYGTYERVFYNCSLKKRKGKSACNNPNVSIEDIEKRLSFFIKEGNYKNVCYNFSKVIEKKCDETIEELSKSINKDNKLEVEENKAKINELKKRQEMLLDSMLDGIITKEILVEKSKILKEEVERLEKINVKLTVSDTEIMDKIEEVKFISKVANEYAKQAPEIITREEFIKEYLICFSVNKNGKVKTMSNIHALLVILNRLRGVITGEISIKELDKWIGN